MKILTPIEKLEQMGNKHNNLVGQFRAFANEMMGQSTEMSLQIKSIVASMNKAGRARYDREFFLKRLDNLLAARKMARKAQSLEGSAAISAQLEAMREEADKEGMMELYLARIGKEEEE